MCRFADIAMSRGTSVGAEALATVLTVASPGIAQPLWESIPALPMPTQFVAGELDAKFAAIATKMAAVKNPASATQKKGTEKQLRTNRNPAELASANDSMESELQSRGAVIIEGAGHAIHTEQPQALVPVIRSFVQATHQAHRTQSLNCSAP